mgnify:CR=1 FL=1
MFYDTEDLSKCQSWKAISLSLISPTFGYVYTRRFRPLIWFCLCSLCLTIGTLATLDRFNADSKVYRIVLAAGIVSGSAIDNSKAIQKARRS